MKKSERGQVGLVGEYAVLSALILNGFNAARTDGNSKDIDILCMNSEFSKMTKVQVKTEGPDTFYQKNKKSLPHYAFHVSTSEKYRTNYRQIILDQEIYFVFYLCPQTSIALEAKPFDRNRTYGRFFVASPEEVVRQLDFQTEHGDCKYLYFRVFEEVDDFCRRVEGDMMGDFENRWDKLRGQA